MRGQIKDGSEDTMEDVMLLAKILGIKLNLERSLDSDSSLVDQISEDISHSGRLRVRNLEEMASPTVEEQSHPGSSSMMTNIGGDNIEDPEMTPLSPLFRIVTTTEDDHDVDLQAMDRVSKYPVFQTQMLSVSCSLCSAECDSKKKLERHMGKCHFRCYKCNKWIKTKQMLLKHIRDSCNFCQEKFSSDDIRDRHTSDVHHRCGYCLKWMKEKS